LCFHGPSSIFKGREPFFTTSYVELGVAFGGKEDEKRRKPDVLNSDQKPHVSPRRLGDKILSRNAMNQRVWPQRLRARDTPGNSFD
jgi:hypothetical protein